ncbi:hypothetical protein [Prescottella subtropica]|uniref:hypothetical protein n=1 Tax=Prescottella subtropica TaxID=2545757 RepID=UPI0010F9F9E8|nr:hypothetical protein [Prescottella subtropica]
MRRRSTEPTIALGLGHYGYPLLAPSSLFKKAVVIVGSSRSGKTRHATSIADQQVHVEGGGNLTIDIKGDDALVKSKARLAEREGRSFLHFTLAPKNGGGYEQPHPYAPPIPARYDPLGRGNGKSKAEMLLKSVPRDGDAAAYLRAAQEITELAWNIAALTGYDRTIGADGRTRISALETLMNMLSVAGEGGGELERQAAALNVPTILSYYPHLSERDAQQRIATLRSRVQSVVGELKKGSSVTAQAASNTRQLVSTYVNSSALFPGTFGTGRSPAGQIDLIRAILRGEIVVISLPAQDYPDFSAMIYSMILLDLQNAVATLRSRKAVVAEYLGVDTSRADSTPWPPFIVQIEELGSAVNSASAEALINLLNKSADIGIRVIASTQALADIRQIDDGKGVWLERLLAQADHLFALQLNAETDDEIVSGFSGKVTKQFATNETEVSNNRLRIFTGASESKKVRGAEQQDTRIPLGTTQALDRSKWEMVYVSKAPKLTAVHTTAPEGPNNWFEIIEMVPVFEPDLGYNPFAADTTLVEATKAAARAKAMELNQELADPNSLLFRIVDGVDEKADIEPAAVVVADASGEVDEPPFPDEFGFGEPDVPDEDQAAIDSFYESVPPESDPGGWDRIP